MLHGNDAKTREFKERVRQAEMDLLKCRQEKADIEIENRDLKEQIDDLRDEIMDHESTIVRLEKKIKQYDASYGESQNEIRALVRKNTMHESKIN